MFLLGGLLCILGVIVSGWGGVSLLFDAGSAVRDKAEGQPANPLAKRGMKGSLRILLIGLAVLVLGAIIMVAAR